MSATGSISCLEGYDRWAVNYPQVPGNPLMRLEQELMLRAWPQVRGAHVLDLACGTGRYTGLLTQAGAASVVALDFSGPMLARVSGAARVQASMTRLPFCDAAFDAVICGLAVGHIPELKPWMREVARVLRRGGALLYSDFHPEAAKAGLKRSFTDERSRTHTLPHFSHDPDAQRAWASAEGLETAAVHEGRAGIEMLEPFPGSEEFYQRWHGLPLVLVVRAEKS
jgi:ubiquinone/menaquinone biosynthesis C-methylase UbiE